MLPRQCRTSSVKYDGLATAELRPRHRRWRGAVLVAKINAPLRQIVGRHLDRDAVARKNTDAVFLHSARRIGEGFVTVVELHAKPRIREKLEHGTFEFDQFFLSQKHLLAVFRKNGGRRVASPRSPSALLGLQIDCRNPPALALLKVIIQGLAFLQAVHAGPLYRTDVDKDVRTATGRLDKPVTLLRVEPFDFAGSHNPRSS